MNDGLPRSARPVAADLDEPLFRLRASAALFTALEEAVVAALSDAARHARATGADGEAEQMENAVRRHRVGLVKYRAVMGAHGLDIGERASRGACLG